MKKIIYSIFILWLTAQSIHARDETIYFQFNNEELVDIVHRLAAKKGINVVFPVKAPITSRITMSVDKPLSLDQAWEKLYTLLDIAGYSLIDKDETYTIVKTDKDIAREALPIYIGTPVEQLPDSDERIRYLYYLSNLQVKDFSDKTSELGAILKEALPEGTNIQTDPITNGLIITDKSNNIKAAMEIVVRLDTITNQEHIKIFKLRYSDATMIAKLFNEDILKTGDASKYRFDTKKQPSEATYFPKNIRLFPITRTNSLLILGTQVAIDRIEDFLYKYIDVELESGKSILHIYQLQYMDVTQIKDVLDKVVGATREGSTGQSKSEGGNIVGGQANERAFDQVIIQTDKPSEGGENAVYFGNNNLIIACRNDDWERIKELIERLDKPQPQVIIEVLIANLTISDTRALGALSRNPLELGFPTGVNMQAAQIGGGVVINPIAPQSLADDMMQNRYTRDSNGNIVDTGVNVASGSPPGSTVIAFDDKKTGESWGVLQMLQSFSYSKVISHPHLIATNNTEARVEIGQTRLIDDQTAGSGGGTSVVKKKNIEAKLIVNITPRINTSDVPGGAEDTVGLRVKVAIEDFIPGDSNNARLTRHVETSATLKNGQILALGGLISNRLEDTSRQTPILSKVPILGWLTKGQAARQNNTNITVFITPTIIEPRLRDGAGQYTKDYAQMGEKYALEGTLFESLRDPITRWYFKKDYDPHQEIKDFVKKDEFKQKRREYKQLVDAEHAEVIETADAIEAPQQTKKKPRKRIVLTNVSSEDLDTETNAALVADAADDTKRVCTSEEYKKQLQKEDPLAKLLESEQEDIFALKNNEITTAYATAPEQSPDISKRNALKELLEQEDNPLF